MYELTNKEMSNMVLKLALEMKASTRKAQAYNIASKIEEKGDECLAEMMINDHKTASHAMRHCEILIEAGLCTQEQTEHQLKNHMHGTFKFIDGSQIN